MATSRRQRNQTGGMLILAIFVMIFLALATIIGCSFANLYFVYNRLQTSADEIALAGANSLNEHDQIGQMNNMIARCRCLVYTDEKTYQKVVSTYPHLQVLADDLLNESRDSATLLESERTKLNTVARHRAQNAMVAKFSSVQPTYTMVLPWLKTDMTAMLAYRMGRINGVESNVDELKGVPGLVTADHAANHVHVAFGSGVSLYKQGTNATLPNPDGGLPFNFSSLSAPIQGTVSPTRVVQSGNFIALSGGQIPSATQVKLSLGVQVGLGASAQGQVSATGSAATVGGDLLQ